MTPSASSFFLTLYSNNNNKNQNYTRVTSLCYCSDYNVCVCLCSYRLVEQLLDGVKNPTSRRMVEDFLGKEVASGNLARLSNGNYSLVDGSSNNMGNGAVATAAAATQNGEVVTKIKPATTPYKEPSHPYDLNEFEEFAEEHDSSSTTHKSSRHTSPKSELEPMKKEDCYEIIVGKRQGDDDGKAKDSNGKLRRILPLIEY